MPSSTRVSRGSAPRRCCSSASRDRTGLSHLCVARSADGLEGWTIDAEHRLLPDVDSETERYGIEDPRITLCGDEYIVNFDEPFGFSVVEAMACGTPVIARPRGSLPELVQPGENGFLVALLDEAAAAVEPAPGLDRARAGLRRAALRRRPDGRRLRRPLPATRLSFELRLGYLSDINGYRVGTPPATDRRDGALRAHPVHRGGEARPRR
jgi:hypothetical protein